MELHRKVLDNLREQIGGDRYNRYGNPVFRLVFIIEKQRLKPNK